MGLKLSLLCGWKDFGKCDLPPPNRLSRYRDGLVCRLRFGPPKLFCSVLPESAHHRQNRFLRYYRQDRERRCTNGCGKSADSNGQFGPPVPLA